MTTITFSEHPEYTARKPHWIKWRDLYEGDHDVLRGADYLWMHELEQERTAGPGGGRLRGIREQRSRYLNLIEPVVSRWLSFLFRKKPIVPESVKKMFGDEYQDVTGKGVGFDSFIRDQVGRDYVLYGKPTIYVDTSSVYARTRAEAKTLGARPYAECLSPLEVVDWQYSEDPAFKGKLEWLRTEYDLLEPRASATDAPKMRRYSKVLTRAGGQYTILTYRTKEQAKGSSTVEWEQVGAPNIIKGWKEIPVSSLCGDSFVKDAAEQQLALFNLMSAESSTLNSQAFQRIWIAGVNNENAKQVLGEYAINFLPAEATVITVEPYNPVPLQSAGDRTIDRLFKVAFNQINGLSADSKESPGAETRREMREEFVAMVETSLGELEDIINEFVGFYAKFKGTESVEPIKLDRTVTIEDMDMFLRLVALFREEIRGCVTWNQETLKKALAYQNLPNGDKITEEIGLIKAKTPEEAAAENEGKGGFGARFGA